MVLIIPDNIEMSESNNSFESENNDQLDSDKLKVKKMSILEKKYFE
jgi:hypothetical protein